MRNTRIYQDTALQSGELIQLDAHAANHIAKVLRLKPGTPLTVFNGQGGEYQATLHEIDKRRVSVEIGNHSTREVESPLSIHLAQAISRTDKMDFVIQKAVELGVTSITPLISVRCNVKLSTERWQKRLTHWNGIIISACEQSGRNTLPILNAPIKLTEYLPSLPDLRGVIATPEGNQSLKEIEGPISGFKVLIGPEGGFCDDEIEQAKQFNFADLKMGPRILRTETAALAAITMLQTSFGDL